jgi:hypothetical protein
MDATEKVLNFTPKLNFALSLLVTNRRFRILGAQPQPSVAVVLSSFASSLLHTPDIEDFHSRCGRFAYFLCSYASNMLQTGFYTKKHEHQPDI